MKGWVRLGKWMKRKGRMIGVLGLEEIKGWLILFFSDNVLYIYS